jgi:hypothetical protein
MAAKKTMAGNDATSNIRAAGFEVSPAPEKSGWMRATRGGCAVLFGITTGNQIEMFRSPGLLRQGKIFRVLDRGYQKFLTDDQSEIPATAPFLEQINDFYQGFKEAIGAPVFFNESLGALTAVTHLDSVERPMVSANKKS